MHEKNENTLNQIIREYRRGNTLIFLLKQGTKNLS